MRIHILTITHKCGENLYPCATVELAEAALNAYVRENWTNHFGDEPPPDDPMEMRDRYFERVEDEGAEINASDVALTGDDLAAAFPALDPKAWLKTEGVLACPQCGRPDQLGTRDLLYGNAWLTRVYLRDGQAVPDYAGETSVDWETQFSIRNGEGHVRLQCGACTHAWFEPRFVQPPYEPADLAEMGIGEMSP